MNKIVFLALSLLISASSFAANDYRLNMLECAASNGVEIKTVKPVADGVLVETVWGNYKKDFIAELGVVGFEAASYLHLNDEEGNTMYQLKLNLNPKASRTQKVQGYILKPNPVSWLPPLAAVAVTCKLQVGERE